MDTELELVNRTAQCAVWKFRSPPKGGAVTPEQAAHIADLAQLELTLPEAREAAAELGRVLEYMDVLDRLDTRGVEPMSHVFPVKNVLREDVPASSLDRTGLLAGAPASDGEAFLVPRTVE